MYDWLKIIAVFSVVAAKKYENKFYLILFLIIRYTV